MADIGDVSDVAISGLMQCGKLPCEVRPSPAISRNCKCFARASVWAYDDWGFIAGVVFSSLRRELLVAA
jgi:hypothetical protein